MPPYRNREAEAGSTSNSATSKPSNSVIVLTRRLLRIIGKGNKERLVPLPQPVLDALGQLWLSHRNPRWLFPNREGVAPVNTSVLADTFTAAVVAAGIRRDVTPHTLRHS